MLQIGHTPDADDAFMFYYLSEKLSKKCNVELVLKDIETLNRKAMLGSIDCSAVSFHTYFKVCHYYDLLSVGACFGENYGPVLVEKLKTQKSVCPTAVSKLKTPQSKIQGIVAVPGENTTAFLLLKIYDKDCTATNHHFEKIPQLVMDGQVEYGLLIHEMQQTYENFGLRKVVDLGEYWYNLTKLPLPLGCIIIRRGLPNTLKLAVKKIIKKSLQYAIKHKDEALTYAMRFARFTDKKQTREFINKYVNKFSLDIKGKYKKAIELLNEYAFNSKLIKRKAEINII